MLQNTTNTLTTSTAPTVNNRKIISVLVKNSITSFLRLRFWIITIDRPPKLASDKDPSVGLMFVECLNALSHARRLTADNILENY